MKLYTEEQVRQMLLIYMANVLLDVDGKMPTIDEILSYRPPIELPSDEEIVFNACKNSIADDFMNDRQIGFVKGCKWIKEFILNQNK